MSNQLSLFELLQNEPSQIVLSPMTSPPPKLTADQRRYLYGPLIMADTSWADTLPDWLRIAITYAREANLAGNLATPEEVLAYLYTAALVAPLDYDAADLYIWLAATIYPKYNTTVNVWAALDETPHDLRPDSQRLYDMLRYDIRRSVIKHAPKEIHL